MAEEWNDAACAAKGLDPRGPEGGEELFSGVGTFVRMAQALRHSMLDIAATGRPRYPGPVRHVPGDRIAVRVVPANLFERILNAGVTGEVWMEPGIDEATVQRHPGRGLPVEPRPTRGSRSCWARATSPRWARATC